MVPSARPTACSMRPAARRRPPRWRMPADTAASRSRRPASPRSCASASCLWGVGEPVGVQPDAESQLVHPLRVVVLVPEQRQRDHRLAEVQALGDGVVAAMGDDQVAHRQHRRPREERRAGHVGSELDLGMHRIARCRRRHQHRTSILAHPGITGRRIDRRPNRRIFRAYGGPAQATERDRFIGRCGSCRLGAVRSPVVAEVSLVHIGVFGARVAGGLWS